MDRRRVLADGTGRGRHDGGVATNNIIGHFGTEQGKGFEVKDMGDLA